MLFSSIAFSQDTNLDSLSIDNMSINYKNPSGEGKIESFKVGIWIGKGDKKRKKPPIEIESLDEAFYNPVKIEDILVNSKREIFDDISLSVEKGGLKIVSDGSELFWEDPPHILKDALGIDVKNFYLSLAPKDISLKSKPLNLSIGKDTFSFDDIYISCGQARGSRDIGRYFIETCTAKLHIITSKLTFLIGKSEIKGFFDRLLIRNGHYPALSIRDIDLIMATNFLTLNASFYISKKSKIQLELEAMVTFDEKTKVFEIIIDEIKLGKVKTTKLFLTLLSALKKEWLVVDKKAKTIYLNVSAM